MAEVTVTDPQNGNSAALNVGTQTPSTSTGSDGNGVHVDGAAISAGLTDEAVPGLLHTPYDNAVTICGYPDLVLNQMLRSMGYREVKAMRFDKFSVDQRKATSVVTENASLVLPAGSKVYKATTGGTEKIVNIKVEDSAIFHESDQIMFKGVKGYDKEGVSHPFYWLNGYVCTVNRSGVNANSIDVILINANPNSDELSLLSSNTLTIKQGTTIIILGHALAEEDAKTVPSAKLPEPTEQYIQKFMTQANVTNVYLDSEKNVNWGLKDIKEGVNREFLLETEKTYWFGHKAYFLDPISNKYVRTTGGFFEQLFEEGVEVIEMWKDELTDETLIETMATIFVGNRGSERRNMLTGMDFAAGIFSLEGMQKQMQVNQNVRRFTYDWNVWKLFNFTIDNKPYSLFDMLGLSNLAVVFDRSNIERCVFRSMDEDMLDLDKLAIEDSKVLRCCEISSIVVKQAKSHRIIVLHKGTKENNPLGANDNEDKYAV